MAGLAVFDFDRTLVDDDSDATALRLLKPSTLEPFSEDTWTAYMAKNFQLLHDQGVTKEQLLNEISKIPITPGMDNLLKNLQSTGWHIIIISDSNEVFIKHWLATNKPEILITDVMTNSAEFDATGKLTISPYQCQSVCNLCPSNMCKGNILSLWEQVAANTYSTVMYVGNGRNDFCPMLHLKPTDIACPRKGHACADLVNTYIATGRQGLLPQKIFTWRNGNEILEVLQNFFYL